MVNLHKINAVFLSSRRHNLPPKLKLRNNQTIQNFGMWIYNNMIFQNELFLRFLPSTYVAWQRRSLGDAKSQDGNTDEFIIFRVLKFRFRITTVSNIMIILSSDAVA